MTYSSSVDHANPYTNQVFQDAVIRNDIAVVKLMLKYGIQPRRNERNMQGLTALHQSVLDGNVRLAILLMEAGADIEAKTSNGWTCLHIAAALGDLNTIMTLLNHCCDLIALTKNEELPIDLAATRDIKIKLAQEMSRIGYSELAQWYMRKLAAREGVCYMLSTDTLLDLACDDKYDRSYTAYPYYVRREGSSDSGSKVPVQPVITKTSSLRRPKEPNTLKLAKSTATNPVTNQVRLQVSPSETKSVQDSGTTTRDVSVTGSPPQKKQNDIVETPGTTPDEPDENFSRFGSLRRNGSTRRSSQGMQRKPSTIELHIDYTNICEDIDENIQGEFEEGFDSAPGYKKQSPTTVTYQQSDYPAPQDMSPHEEHNNKYRNVRFNSEDTSNEFCNCPNCKKMGYAFSPDIQASSRKPLQINKPMFISPNKSYGYQQTYEMLYASNYGNRQFYVPLAGNDAFYIPSDYNKPRKRKKKLFSGFKSIFKDNTKGNRNMEFVNALDDQGIVFTPPPMPETNKAAAIKQRNQVRRSNSFSDPRSESKDINVYSHSQVIPPASKYTYEDQNDEETFETQQSDGESSFRSSTSTITPAEENTEGQLPNGSTVIYENLDFIQQKQKPVYEQENGNIFQGYYPYLDGNNAAPQKYYDDISSYECTCGDCEVCNADPSNLKGNYNGALI